jgi:hypothetical protein
MDANEPPTEAPAPHRRCEECCYGAAAIRQWSPDPRFCQGCWDDGYGHGLAGGPVSKLTEAERVALYPQSRTVFSSGEMSQA